MKVVLCAINAKYIHSNLGVYSLYTYAKEYLGRYSVEMGEDNKNSIDSDKTNCADSIDNSNKSYPENIDIKIREYTINNDTSRIMESLYMENADIIAFSCYIWNIDIILALSKELKKVQPDLSIWLGGPEVSYDSKKLLSSNDFIELVMRGEGEKTFAELVLREALSNRCLMYDRDSNADTGVAACKCDYPKGVTVRCGNEIISTPDRPPLSMDELPFVYDRLEDFENRIIYYESQRGCPFRCSYCLSSIDKGLRLKSFEIVKKELQYFLDNKVKQVKFIDRTFNADKKHSRAIWEYICSHDNGVTNFHFEVSADLLTDEDFEIIGRMRRGLIQLEIGMQTTNEATIAEIRRTMNIDRLRYSMEKLTALGNSHLHLDLIAGLPFEDVVSFKKSFDDAWDMKPDNLQLGFLKVLKGSYMEEQSTEYGLLYSDHPPYEILENKWLSYYDIIRLKHIEQVLEIYGNSRQYVYSLQYLMDFIESPFDFFDRLGEYYSCCGYAEISLNRVDRYNVLLSFAENELRFDSKQIEILRQLLTVDIYHRENIKSRPKFANDISCINKQVMEFFVNGCNDSYRITAEDYDSKAYARKMHIEPVSVDIYNISRDMDFSDMLYLLFDYDNRNPIDYNCDIIVLERLD